MHTNELAQIRQQLELLRQSVSELANIQCQMARTLPDMGAVRDQLDRLQERLAQPAAGPAEEGSPGDDAHAERLRAREIIVERISLCEADGTLRLVLCNTRQSPGHVMDGRVFGKSPGQREAGIYFFDDEGNECGGLIYGGKREGSGYQAGGSLTFDQYRQDQVIGIQQEDANGQRRAGLRIWDRPDMPVDEWVRRCAPVFDLPEGPDKHAALKRLREEGLVGALRIFVGKNSQEEAGIVLCDAQGRIRLRLAVEAAGNPRLEFLDERGAVIARLPG